MSAPYQSDTQRQPSARVSAAIALAVLAATPELRAVLFADTAPVHRVGIETWLKSNERGAEP